MLKNSPRDIKLDTDRLEGIFRGVVEDNSSDPEKAGRCRVRVWGVHTAKKGQDDFEGIPTDHLPWAEPACGLLGGAISGIGIFTIPVQGSHVYVFFENGDILAPRYFATAPGIPATAADRNAGFNDPAGEYPLDNRLDNQDWNRLARGNPEPLETKSFSYAAEYPHNDMIKTKGGIVIELDNTPNNKRIHVRHPAGAYVEINESGNIRIKGTRIDLNPSV